MVCIYCKGNLAVSNSRPQKSRNQTWRRRPCKTCGAVFTSIEAIDLSQALTVSTAPQTRRRSAEQSSASNTGNKSKLPDLQPYDRDRLFVSLHASLQHRPSAISDARGLCETITAHITGLAQNGRVDSRTIAETALNTLQRFDAAAATHYAAFHPQK